MNVRRTPQRGRRSVGVIVAGGALCALALAGCSDNGEEQTDLDAFCAQASANQNLIVDPPLADEQQIAATMEFYRLMGALAPVEISDDWQQLGDLLVTANDVVPGDETSEQLVAQAAYASEAAAYNIAVWVEQNCGVTLPITTIVSHTIPPAQPPLDTYVPPPTTTPASIPASVPQTTPPTGPVSTNPVVSTGAPTAPPPSATPTIPTATIPTATVPTAVTTAAPG